VSSVRQEAKDTSMMPPRLNVAEEREALDEDAGERESGVGPDPAEGGQRPRAPAAASAQPLHGLPANIAALPSADRREKLRILEALLFAAAQPLDEARLAGHLAPGTEVAPLLAELQGFYASRGINLVRVAGKWAFRTAEDLSYLLERHATEERRLSKAALETLSIIAYHQPVTRAEIEEIRGVQTSKGTLDVLMETGWIRPRGRRRAPGKPITYGTTEAFLGHFGLDGIKDLPGLAELKGAGLLDSNLPPDFKVPEPTDVAALMPDELPLDAIGEEDGQGELALADEPAEEGAEDGAGEVPPSADLDVPPGEPQS
jgi:segregation and condensation protein B